MLKVFLVDNCPDCADIYPRQILVITDEEFSRARYLTRRVVWKKKRAILKGTFAGLNQ
jgi:hypothetical protein